MPKLLAATITLVVAILVFFGILSFQDKAGIERLERSPERGKLVWYAQLAKAKGQHRVDLRPTVDYAVPRTWDDALANYHLVVAEPVYSKSYATTYDVQTWYKLRVVEELSAPNASCADCGSTITPPAELLPVQTGEFLTAKQGGETMVEGVRVTSSDPSFPDFETGKRYLLLVQFDSQKIVGMLRTGPWGAFAMDSDERLKPLNAELRHAFREKLSDQFGNSLSHLRRSLKTKN